MPEPTRGATLTVSPFRRPTMETMPTNAKACCLYPKNACDRRRQGARFDNALVLDMVGNVAENATANIVLVKDGVVATPAENGTFLAGITRSRVVERLHWAGHRGDTAATLSVADFLDADEVFSSGNYGKVLPVTKLDGREFQPGPVFHREASSISSLRNAERGSAGCCAGVLGRA